VKVRTKIAEFTLVPAGGNALDQAAVAEHIQGCRLLGEETRFALRKHDDGSAKLDALGDRGNVAERDGCFQDGSVGFGLVGGHEHVVRGAEGVVTKRFSFSSKRDDSLT
jgi:hypothetical protein